MLLMVMVAGCTHNLTKLTDRELYSRTSDAQNASIDPDGNIKSSFHGVGATLLIQDAEGNWTNMPGPVGVLSAPLPTGGVGYIISPKDTRIAKIIYTPEPNAGEPQVVIEGLEANLSEPLAQQVAALSIALPILRDMTKEEALAAVEKWKAAQEIAPTLANLLVQIIATW